VPGGPRKCTTSLRSMNSNSASAMIRFRSSEGWNEKSKPANVLIVDSRAIIRAILIRRFSRRVSSSASSASMALDGGQFTAFDAAHRHVEDLDRTRHLEADKGLLDAVD
jgi:hypothetical protein